ncbi:MULTISPECIES: aryl-sulfate sulfotransferase [unclassified Leifsonia]|uniref:aryl-sulfate sulfotransferase n=1 Tax=unclassified Leifsonia TaxID=2663824 RepID=UPI0008A74BB8|nr:MULTISPECIES: aryl-sulfate sulfotransferase [unclassified Leifsonia]SEI15306.1 Arylsulfotransferase (ASST) [Leifsonia sp. CL154]SFM04702.1 Arylsulfotransferase (ASST) [Leifsonia sp. CL147]
MNVPSATGVIRLDRARVHDSLILFGGPDGVSRLIDLDGEVRHEWPFYGVPARIIDPAMNGGRLGDIGVQLSEVEDSPGGIYANRTVGQVSWEGDVLWEWGSEAPGGAARQNHDWELLPNGNRLFLVTIPRVVPGLGPQVVGDQGIYEVTPGGDIAWSWRAGDHLQEFGFSESGWEHLRSTVDRRPDDVWGYLEMNSMKTLGPNKWHDADPETVFQPDNIIFSTRKANVVGIIDKSTGALVWRMGPYYGEEPGAEHQRINRFSLPRPVDQLSGQHNPHFIGEGLPGAGNILVFDNQGGAGYPPAPLGIYAGSRVLEIDPSTKEIVWQYTAEDSGRPSWEFHSSFVSNAQRLPNGNTLITEGMRGRLFQVTREGEIVWEYRSPYEAPGIAGEPEVQAATVPGVDRLSMTRLIYRSQAVPFEWVPDEAAPTPELVGQRISC